MHVIDLEGNEYPAQLTATWDGELIGNRKLTAKIKPSKANLQFIHDIAEMWQVVDDDDTAYKILYCKRKGAGNLLNADIKALPLFFDEFNTQRVHRRIDQHLTANAFFNIVFHEEDELGNPSGYNFILNGTFEAQQWEGLAEGDTRLKMFQDGLNRYKAEFRIVGNTIYIENQIGIDSQARYEHRLNASNIVQEIDANEFYTYAKGYGDYGDGQGGEDWQKAKVIREYTSPLANIPGIGIREAPPIKNGNITTQSTMDSQLKILVDESLKISVSADIHDLRKQNYPIAQSNLGDRVFLIDRRIGFEEEVRVVAKSITKNWKGEIIALNLTFGELNITKRHQASMNTAMKNITSLLEGKIKLPFSVLDNAVAEATKALHAAQTEISFSENGLLSVDKTNPNLVTLLNSAGFGVSDDGGASFENAITGLGINASVIYTGTMLADRIAGGILQSLNGNTEFNLNTGKLIMSNTDFELGGGANIRFTDRNNRLLYVNNSIYAGIQFDHSLGDTDNPMIGIGISDHQHSVNDPTFRGIRIHSLGVEGLQGYGTNIITQQFTLNNIADMTGTGFVFKMHALSGTGNRGFYPLYTGDRAYDLGSFANSWDDFYIRGDVMGSGDLDFRNKNADQQGFRMELGYGGEPHMAFYGLSYGNYYSLGKPDRTFSYGYINQLRGTSVGSSNDPYNYVYTNHLVETSSVNAKMNIEDVNPYIATDFIDMAKVYKYNYKNDDITDRFSKRVGVVVEQLDPANEELFKASESTMDLNSVIYLNMLGLQNTRKEMKELLKRLEVLENGTTTA